jgi:hypothetical protein
MATMTTRMTAAVVAAVAVATQATAVPAVVWVVARPCCYVRLAHRDVPKKLLATAKWGLLEWSFQDKNL